VKTACRFLVPACMLLLCASFASAQSSADVSIGLGSAHVKANTGGIDDTTGLPCAIGSGSTCDTLPSLGGVFMSIGGDLMLNKRYGFGGEASFQPSRTAYGPVDYRETFYDINGIYVPLSEKRVAVQIQGGIGGARTGFSVSSTSCVGTSCTSQSQPLFSNNHFQVHAGVGLSLFVTEHIFIRPQFDLHYVPGLTNQFGSNIVPEGTVWLGYSFGSRN
jgi:Outer membrane protein beta-barrel domain